MKQIEEEIKAIKEYHDQMWDLVEHQVNKAFAALEKNDKDLAREVIAREKTVNVQELVVDHHCENFIALFNPVAVDLRFVISLLKINNNLERIGDFAESIALFVLYHQTRPLDAELCKQLQLKKMMDCAGQMVGMAREALRQEDSKMAGRVLALDDTIDTINHNAVEVLTDYITAHPEHTKEILYLYGVIRRIERVGDRTSNIAEDIVFYVDAKELRHRNK